MPASQSKWLALLLLSSFLYAGILQLVANQQPEEYMDEPYHVGQTKRYCNGDWGSWDPKITTLPGLYLLAWVYVHLTSIMTATSVVELCDLNVLRSLNCVLAPCFLILAYRVHTLLHGPSTTQQLSALMATALALFPLHFFFSFLYYTDVGSTLFVLLCQYLALKEWFTAAALAGVAAVMFRQTNAVWVTFITATSMLRFCSTPKPTKYAHLLPVDDDDEGEDDINNKQHKQPEAVQETATSGTAGGESCGMGEESLFEETKRVLRVLLAELSTVLSIFWPLLLIPVGFVIFMVVNKGIVVGDRSAHTPVKHWAQALYVCLYTAAAFAPATIPHLLSLTHNLTSSPVSTILVSILGIGASILATHYGTLAHPYLLADNRHYTFYIWRKLLARHWAIKYVLAPVYVLGASLLWTALGKGGRSKLWRLGFAACVTATVVPAWLVEFRYFSVPAMLFALHMKVPSRQQMILVILGFVFVNLITLYLFLYKPFTWPDGSTARFMW